MTRIPVDAAAPVACTASGDALSSRIDEIARLRDELRAVERTPTGLVLHFAPDPGLERHLERFTVEEKACCRFWGFEVRRTSGELTLVWDGPAEAQPLLDQLEAGLRGDGPLTALAGLL